MKSNSILIFFCINTCHPIGIDRAIDALEFEGWPCKELRSRVMKIDEKRVFCIHLILQTEINFPPRSRCRGLSEINTCCLLKCDSTKIIKDVIIVYYPIEISLKIGVRYK